MLAYDTCIAAHLPEDFADVARELILATKHDAIPDGIDAKVLIDVDLSILGRSPDVFDEYERKIRKEYLWIPEYQFRKRRGAILHTFLDRDPVYLTDFFRKKYESKARENLQRSIEALR